MNRYLRFSISPVVMALAFTAGCDDKADVTPAARYVLSATAHSGMPEERRLAGTVQARTTSSLSFQTQGRVVSRYVEVGDYVKAGQVLARLDPRALTFSVQSEQASLQDALAKRQNALNTAKRQRSLAAAKATSVEDLEEAEQSLTSAQETVGEAQARLRKAGKQLSYTELKAQFDGVITSVSVEAGQTVSSGQTVLDVAHVNERDAVVDMPDAQLKNVTSGHQFELALQMAPSVKCTGEVREIAPAADATTRLRRVKIALKDAPDTFRIGSVITAAPVMTTHQDNPLFVPDTAILELRQAHYVWVINPSSLTVSMRKIQSIPSSQAGTARVLSGLREGEQVVIAGVHSLQSGEKIRIERASSL